MRSLLTLVTVMLLSAPAWALELKQVVPDSLSEGEGIFINVYNDSGATMNNGQVVIFDYAAANANGRNVRLARVTGDGPVAGVVNHNRCNEPIGRKPVGGCILSGEWGRVQVYGYYDRVSMDGSLATFPISAGVALVAGTTGHAWSPLSIGTSPYSDNDLVTRSVAVFGIALEPLASRGNGKMFIKNL